MFHEPDSDNKWAVLVLFVAAMSLFAAVLLMVRLLLPRESQCPLRRAIVHWLPIATAAITCAALGRQEMATALVFGTSVALVSTIAGFVTMIGRSDSVPSAWQPLWVFAPVAGLLAFVIGFRGVIGWFDAIALLAQGAIVYWLMTSASPPVSSAEAVPTAPRHALRWLLIIPSALAVIALVVLAAWAATLGAADLHRLQPHYTPGVIAGAAMSIALTLPLISTGSPLAADGRASLALSTQLAIVLLNLCVLLPLLLLTALVAQRPTSAQELTQFLRLTRLDYPRAVWRIDAIAVVIGSMLLMPVGVGRIRLDRTLALGLILAYGVYLATMLAFGGTT